MSVSNLKNAIRDWQCLSNDGHKFIEAARAVVAALDGGLSVDEVAKLLRAEFDTPPGYKDPQNTECEIEIMLHRLQHTTGKIIKSVQIQSRETDSGRKAWSVNITL